MITTTLNKIAAAWAAGDAADAAARDAAGDAQKREFLRIVEEGK